MQAPFRRELMTWPLILKSTLQREKEIMMFVIKLDELIYMIAR